MKKIICYALFGAFLLTSCVKDEIPSQEEYTKQKISENVEKVFGTKFDPNHTWCTTVSSEVNITNIPNGVKEVQLLVQVKEEDGETSISMLNKAEVNGKKDITLKYDAPSDNVGLFIAYISNDIYDVKRVGGTTRGTSMTRATEVSYTLPSGTPTIGKIEDSYASIRGWINGEKLYQMNEYQSQKMIVSDYSAEYKNIFRNIIFSYFKNGRKYNNLPLVKASGYYNESSYPITTGEDPIILSPVYKNDSIYEEIVNSDLYYYYFKEEDLGNNPVEYLENLPKYKAIQFNECIKDNNVICKHASYALVYWGDGIPAIGTEGSYTFPKGYKIGFMVRAKTTAENGKKQGELYGDGRLNNYINSYSKCNFRSSNLGTDGPRAAWLSLSGKMLLCFESGTDRDFNDIIIEVEGGVEPIIPIPDIDAKDYTFCFEDTQFGDYDLNDIVIKAKRLNETQVQYSIVACGALDKISVMNINGKKIKDNTEVHELFGVNGGYVNTEKNGITYEAVIDTVKVNKNFSFLDDTTQPYIYDITTSNVVRVSKKGEDPHGIMIPYDFKYPLEKICVKNAYLQFNNWGENPINNTDWYLYPVEDNVF